MASVDSIIAEQSVRADNYSKKSDSALREAMNAASSMLTDITASKIYWSPAIDNLPPTTSTQTIDAQFAAPTKPADFDRNSFQALDPIYAQFPAPYEVDMTGLFDQQEPAITTPEFTEATPEPDFTTIDSMLATIEVPVLNDIDMPVLSNASIGAMPTVTIPTFNSNLVVDDPGQLDTVHTQFVAEYKRVSPEMKAFIDDGVRGWESDYSPSYRTSLAALEAKLQDGLDRGTALSEDYETALYTRSRSRTETEFNRASDNIMNDARKSGFVIPSGAIRAGIAQTHLETAKALSVQATEIAIKRSEQEIQHIQFVLSTSANLRQSMAQLFTQYAGTIAQINQMANEHGKAYAGLLLDAYRAMLERFRVQLEKFKTEAAIYETQLKASLATLDIYRLELEAVKLTTDIDTLKLETVSKKIQIELSKVNLFSELLKSVDTRANVEKTKMGIFGDKVDAYVKRLSGDELKTKIYLAALQGDEGKMKGELGKLEASVAGIDAESKRIDAIVKSQQLRSENNRMLLDIYRTEYDIYKTKVGAEVNVFEGNLKRDISLLEAYKANKMLELDVYRAKLIQDELLLNKATNQAEIESKTSFKYVDALVQHWDTMSRIAAQVGGTYGQIAGAALASQNTMVSSATSA